MKRDWIWNIITQYWREHDSSAGGEQEYLVDHDVALVAFIPQTRRLVGSYARQPSIRRRLAFNGLFFSGNPDPPQRFAGLNSLFRYWVAPHESVVMRRPPWGELWRPPAARCVPGSCRPSDVAKARPPLGGHGSGASRPSSRHGRSERRPWPGCAPATCVARGHGGAGARGASTCCRSCRPAPSRWSAARTGKLVRELCFCYEVYLLKGGIMLQRTHMTL